MGRLNQGAADFFNKTDGLTTVRPLITLYTHVLAGGATRTGGFRKAGVTGGVQYSVPALKTFTIVAARVRMDAAPSAVWTADLTYCDTTEPFDGPTTGTNPVTFLSQAMGGSTSDFDVTWSFPGGTIVVPAGKFITGDSGTNWGGTIILYGYES